MLEINKHILQKKTVEIFHLNDCVGPTVKKIWLLSFINSVTRLGDILDFGQLFKAFGNN